MTKVYPNAAANASERLVSKASCCVQEEVGNKEAVVLTVWKKSLLLNCHGFTVFDAKGNLVFRVDNYMAGGNRGQILLMDAAGKPLFTIRRKRLSLGESWLVSEGETTLNPRFTAKKHYVNLLNTKCLAHVIAAPSNGSSSSSTVVNNKKIKKVGMVYEVDGSYAERCCAVYECSMSKRKVAEIKRKEVVGRQGVVFGIDVFQLIVNTHHIQLEDAMSFLILLDQMFPSSSSSSSK